MNEIGRRITEKLIEIHGSTDFVIGFLPYKRSMWNSMASVYEECRKAGAVAYILPLPYYLMPDKQIVNEQDLFPEAGTLDISMIKKISFDYLVIHYPYDGNNRVTSMLPEYYTAQLRNYGKVIFIPYSCSPGIFTRLHSGLANIDYAFLTSEAERDAFITEWQAHGVDFSGRVFGYGSPKMDAMAKLEQGKGKYLTTVVINSLAPYLSAPFRRLELYQEHITNEIGRCRRVIFRPHPLLRQTIKSMRPDTAKAYSQFIKWCNEQENVIVDETENLEQALEEADYLISDPSSVLEMWQSTGREYTVI
ncbi:MAG: hypothetical protein IKE92_11395 [Clostridiales bacterium]|nr:hypothetical protein [Clostridiales bacterium]